MKLMKTAEEMYMYCVENNTGTGSSVDWSVNHFKVVEDCLEKDEYGIIAFMAAHYTSEQQPELQYGNVITNKRLIMGQQNTLKQRLKIVPLNELNDMIITAKNGIANLFVETAKAQFRMSLGTSEGENLKELYNGILEQIKEKRGKTDTSTIDEIREYKKLMDEGVLTEEEFAEKKRQLLNADTKDNFLQEIILDININDYKPEKAEEVKEEFAVEKKAREYRSGRWGRIITRSCVAVAIVCLIYVLLNPIE